MCSKQFRQFERSFLVCVCFVQLFKMKMVTIVTLNIGRYKHDKAVVPDQTASEGCSGSAGFPVLSAF